jgi:hypothetical protein
MEAALAAFMETHMKCKVLTPIRHDGNDYAEGDEIELAKKSAEALLAVSAVQVIAEAAEELRDPTKPGADAPTEPGADAPAEPGADAPAEHAEIEAEVPTKTTKGK